MPRTRRRGTGGRFAKGGGRSDGRFSLHPENPIPESRMHVTVPVRFGRGRLDSLVTKGLAAYLIAPWLRFVWSCRESPDPAGRKPVKRFCYLRTKGARGQQHAVEAT